MNKNKAGFVSKTKHLKLSRTQVCSMCDQAFMKGQGKCLTADFPNDYMHAHCMKLFKEDQEAYTHGDTININSQSVKDDLEAYNLYWQKKVSTTVEEVFEEILDREIFTGGKKANAKTLSSL